MRFFFFFHHSKKNLNLNKESHTKKMTEFIESAGDELDVTFSPTFVSEKLVLMEIPKGMENVFENKDSTLCFKGNENNGGMVMCTSEKTFSVRRVESSNTSLLAPKAVSDDKSLLVESGVSCYYELMPTHPKTKLLWSMLSANPFRFQEKSGENEKRPTGKSISHALPASEEEIRSELNRLKAIEFEGRWSIVDEACLDEAFNHLVREMDANQWSGKEFPRSKWVSTFSAADESCRMRQLIANVLCERIADVNTKKDHNVILNFRSVAAYRASQILRELPQKEWSEEEFFCEWQSRLPDFEGKEPNMSWLEGMILMSCVHDVEKTTQEKMVVDDVDEKMEEESNETTFKMFPLRDHEIASNASERFDQLFSIRSSWSLPSLRPFIKDLIAKSSSEADLLVNFTRPYEAEDGTKMCSRK